MAVRMLRSLFMLAKVALHLHKTTEYVQVLLSPLSQRLFHCSFARFQRLLLTFCANPFYETLCRREASPDYS